MHSMSASTLQTNERQEILSAAAGAAVEAARVALEIRARPRLGGPEGIATEAQLNDPDIAANHFVVAKKGDGSTVTNGDLAAQQVIHDRLAAALPGAQFMEEEGPKGSVMAESGSQWIIDPIDGTGAYVRGATPSEPRRDRQWGNIIALHHDGKPVLAAMFIPYQDATATALNGELYVATQDSPTQIIPVENGVIRQEMAYAPPPPQKNPDFAYGLFDVGLIGQPEPHGRDEIGKKLRAAAAARGCSQGKLHCFAAGTADVIQGRGACANGINCAWDSATYLLLKQAGRPVIEYDSGKAADGVPRYTVIAAADPELFKALNDAFNTHAGDKKPALLRHGNLPSALPRRPVSQSPWFGFC